MPACLFLRFLSLCGAFFDVLICVDCVCVLLFCCLEAKSKLSPVATETERAVVIAVDVRSAAAVEFVRIAVVSNVDVVFIAVVG